MRPQRQTGCSFLPTIARFPLLKGAKRKAREMTLLNKFQPRKHCSRTQLWQKRGHSSWWDHSVRRGARLFLCTIARFQSKEKQNWAMPKIYTIILPGNLWLHLEFTYRKIERMLQWPGQDKDMECAPFLVCEVGVPHNTALLSANKRSSTRTVRYSKR